MRQRNESRSQPNLKNPSENVTVREGAAYDMWFLPFKPKTYEF